VLFLFNILENEQSVALFTAEFCGVEGFAHGCEIGNYPARGLNIAANIKLTRSGPNA
jgi:hypothetical protein